jgi:error-prone DNA polymerase
MARLYRRHPEALARLPEIVERCRFSPEELEYQYPSEVVIPGMSPQQALEYLTWEAVRAQQEGSRRADVR